MLTGCTLLTPPHASRGCRPQALTTEYLTNPIAIDTLTPRLSWQLQSLDPRATALVQTAYHLEVYAGTRCVWNSGTVPSAQSINILYAGIPLTSSTVYRWRVRTWTTGSDAAPWSDFATFTTGLLNAGDWRAQWIGAHPATQPEFACGEAAWLGILNAPAKTHLYLRKVITLPVYSPETPVCLAITGDETYTVWVNGQEAMKTWGHINRPRWMRFVNIAQNLMAGTNVIAIQVARNTSGHLGILASLHLPDDARVVTDYTWSATKRVSADWKTNLSDTTAWSPAPVVAALDAEPWGKIERRRETQSPAFEKTFTLAKPVHHAFLHISGLGFYEAFLNQTRIGNKVLDPIPTRYDKRVLYSTYPVEQHLTPGTNTLHVLLGHGWYDVRSVAVWNFDNAPWRSAPKLIAQLEVTYTDQTTETIVTDASWQQIAHPVRFDCIREGEIIQPVDSPSPHTAYPAICVAPPEGKLVAEALPPTRITDLIRPHVIRAAAPHTWLIDFGQNMAGWARLTLRHPQKGQCLTFRYGERLTPEGRLDQNPIREHFHYSASFHILPNGGFQTDRYVCSGIPDETYAPRFVYHGFQYVEIEGLECAPESADIVACVVRTDFPETGRFACSHPLINKIQEATLRSYRGNYVNGYPTDCPHREKNGWTADAHLAAEQAQYNVQNTAAYEKWVYDLIDEQQPDGNLPGIVPTSGWGYTWGNGPAWDSALFIIPWTLYTYQADKKILEDVYPAMLRYLHYLETHEKNGLVDHGLGDWVPAKTETPVAVTSTGYYFQDLMIAAQCADILGQAADKTNLLARAQRVQHAFQTMLYNGNGIYSIGSQTAQACALHQGLVTAQTQPLAEKQLIQQVIDNQDYLDFGILGAKYTFRALSEAGRTDLAFAMATQTRRPSYGYSLEHGATTLWEDWRNGSSRNHIMLGDISAWFYQYLAGIRLADRVSAVGLHTDPQATGFKTFLIAPDPVLGLDWVEAEHHSPYGIIAVRWELTNACFRLHAKIPVNTTAVIVLPISEQAVAVPTTLTRIAPRRGRQSYHAGSGTVTLECPASALLPEFRRCGDATKTNPVCNSSTLPFNTLSR